MIIRTRLKQAPIIEARPLLPLGLLGGRNQTLDYELNAEKDLIKAKEVPTRCYNYSYIKDILENDYNQKVSLSIIINRKKVNDFYLTKPKRKVHDRKVITNYPGEMSQHDFSHY